MATPINAPMAGELWHLSIEDLFQPVTEVQRLGGDGPFVINLSVSTAPINTPTNAFAGCRDAHTYQIQVTEDGRTRYRLRLGPFANEDQADVVLAEVRETYPAALTATAGASDLRVIASMQPKVEPKHIDVQDRVQASELKAAVAKFIGSAPPQTRAAAKQSAEVEDEISIDIAWPTPELVVPSGIESAPAAIKPVVEGPFAKVPVPTQAVAPALKAPPKVTPKAAAPVITPIPIAPDAPVLTEAVVPKPKPATAVRQAPACAPKSPGPAMAASSARMSAPGAVAPVAARTSVAAPKSVAARTSVAAPKPSAAAPVPKAVAKATIFAQAIASALKPPAPKPLPVRQVVVATAPAPAAREVRRLDQPLQSLEHTQTVRALTAKELEDIESSRWFVIQLASADRAFDPDAVPNLDIFSEYRLYSVAGLDQGRVVHALRLGFFREEIGAVAVASYLAAYWDKPTIKRVSVAERERFANQKVEARKDVDATGSHAIIEITDELIAPRQRKPNNTASVKGPNQPVGH